MNHLKSALLAVSAVMGIAIGAGGAAAEESPKTAIKAARLFDANTGRIISPGLVVVENNKVVAVGGDIPDGAAVIDLGDATLLPGLIDAHTHLTDWMTDDWGTRYLASDAEIAFAGASAARKAIDLGFTTVRDLWSRRRADVYLRDAIDRGDIPGPRIIASAIALGARGGHCENALVDFDPTPGLEGGVAVGADGFRDAVRHAVKRGADVIKVCAASGIMSSADSPDRVELTQAEIDAVVEQAHLMGRKVAVHTHSDRGARMAITAGADSIEHGSFATRDTLALMKRKGVFLVADILAAEYGEGTFGEVEGLDEQQKRKSHEAYVAFVKMLETAISMDVKVAFGTDSGAYPHGLNAKQFGLLVDRGMTNAEALQSATVVAADLLGLSDEIGALSPGMRADIVAAPGNPLEDIATMENVFFVMKGGSVHTNENR